MINEVAVSNAVLASAAENSSLLVRLSSTSEAPSILRAQRTHVSRIHDALAEQTAVLEKLKESVDAQSKKHKKFRDSITRRFLYRATHTLEKFDMKAKKAERDYFAALGMKSKAEERRALLERDYDEAVTAQGPLEQDAKEHDEIHEKIDRLYESLFAGPTPGFPQEDEEERAFYARRAENEATKEKILATRRAVKLLNAAQSSLRQAQLYLESARRQAEDSFLFFDDAIQSLRQANGRLTYVLRAINATEKHLHPLSPQLSSANRILILHLNAAKISTEEEAYYSRDKILSAVASVQGSFSENEDMLKELIEAVKQSEQNALADIRGTARRLEDTRQELQQVRQGIFEKVAGFGEAAPAYTVCCDRVDRYCIIPDEEQVHEAQLGIETSFDFVVADAHEPPRYEYE